MYPKIRPRPGLDIFFKKRGISFLDRMKVVLFKLFPRFFAGDWKSFEELVAPEMLREETKFDLILTSETIYNMKNQHKLISIFKNLLKKNGQV